MTPPEWGNEPRTTNQFEVFPMSLTVFAETWFSDWSGPALVAGGVLLLFILFFLVVFFSVVRLWVQCLLTGAGIGIWDLVGMKLRNVDYDMIVRQKIALVQAGVKLSTRDLEAHFLARGNVPKVATAVIAAHKGSMDLPWRTASAIDLAGRDVLEAVRIS